MQVSNINTVLNTTKNNQSIGVKLAHLTGDKDICVFAIELAPNQSIAAHYHKIGIETYFIVSGQGTIYLGTLSDKKVIWDNKTNVIQGDCFTIEPNQVHKFKNTSDQQLRIIATAPLTHCTDEDRFFV